MSKMRQSTVIRKYANRRLYDTGSSSYVTLQDLAAMVRADVDFVVIDAKSDDDITHEVLTQIILEEETRGPHLLPVNFLRQLIRFYGDELQAMVPAFLEYSIGQFAREQGKMRGIASEALGEKLGEQARLNAESFERAVRAALPGEAPEPESRAADIDALRGELEAMRRRLDRLAPE
ncbi:polyhydroxyalkanoate synthesis repressor PhaR [Pleomorphomonas koreensis]|uniref:polyhydroxyalkanoate synthesis repressor PhaR n=1 Tax=Pleomorphomonas koreensis TaxID=257440 RepID=UPI00040A0F46|nr:polyhydroxyalkanoate synthesis repressor PhaR [Pleomorphomonas koreensis]